LDELSNQRHFNPTPLPAATSRRLLVISLLVVIIASVGSIASYWVAGKFAWAPWAPLLFVSIAFPAFGGFAGGLLIRGRHLKLYWILGGLVGLIDLIGMLLIYQGSLWPLPSHDWLSIVLVFLVPVRFRKFGKLLTVTEQFASQSGLR
jgi:hypothetical protein